LGFLVETLCSLFQFWILKISPIYLPLSDLTTWRLFVRAGYLYMIISIDMQKEGSPSMRDEVHEDQRVSIKNAPRRVKMT